MSNSTELWERYSALSEGLEEVSLEGKSADRNKIRIQNEIELREIRVSELKDELESIRSSLQSESERLYSDQSKMEIISAEFKAIQESFDDISSKKIAARKEFLDSNKHVGGGPLELADRPAARGDFTANFNLHSLGDIHGWAPGLINWLDSRNLADCYIGNNLLTKNGEKSPRYEEIFPDEEHLWDSNLHELPAWPNGSPFFDPQMPTRFYEIEAVWKGSPDDLFIQIGDLIDRGDYSEVTIELIRRLIWNSCGSCFVLMGNHEQMVLGANYVTWESNENRAVYNSSGPGTLRFSLDRNTYSGRKRKEESEVAKAKEELKCSTFKSLRAHLAHLLLTQELSIRKSLAPESLKRWESMTNPSLVAGGIDPSELERIVTLAGWDGPLRSLDWLDKLPEGQPLPGAIAVMKVRETVFTHAEPTGLYCLKNEDWEEISHPFSFNNGLSASIILLDNNPYQKSRYKEILWDRRAWNNETETSPMATEVASDISSRLSCNHLRLIHGHTQRKTGIGSRKLFDSISITNLDESMTPYYLFNIGVPSPYSLDKTPTGWVIGDESTIPKSVLSSLDIGPGVDVKDISESVGPASGKKVYDLKLQGRTTIRVESENGLVRIGGKYLQRSMRCIKGENQLDFSEWYELKMGEKIELIKKFKTAPARRIAQISLANDSSSKTGVGDDDDPVDPPPEWDDTDGDGVADVANPFEIGDE